jgi:hypothetical protein
MTPQIKQVAPLTSVSQMCYICVPHGGKGVEGVGEHTGQDHASQEQGQ